MPRLLQINPVLRLSTSTGRIMREIGEVAMANGWESYMAYSYGRDGIMQCSSHTIPVGDKWDVFFHGCSTRLFDRHGLCSTRATRRFVEQLEVLDPDIVHIHNIHGYFLNYKILFDYLRRRGKKVVWTVHDCWLYTGHCYYYSAVKCDKWKTGCVKCPQRRQFPSSWLIDRSAKNFRDKKAAFTSLSRDNFVIVPVSEWISKEISQSFLKDYPNVVIHNGIDLDVFKPGDDMSIRERYSLGGSRLYIGVASIWLDEKGLPDLLKMAEMLTPDERIVLVGKMSHKTECSLPGNVTHIHRTENVNELAALYSTATVLLNPTWQDNYPTVNLEAQACGTPVVTYSTGGSPESLSKATGAVVEQGNILQMLMAAREFAMKNREELRDSCRTHALAHFAKADRYNDYIKLYRSIL